MRLILSSESQTRAKEKGLLLSPLHLSMPQISKRQFAWNPGLCNISCCSKSENSLGRLHKSGSRCLGLKGQALGSEGCQAGPGWLPQSDLSEKQCMKCMMSLASLVVPSSPRPGNLPSSLMGIEFSVLNQPWIAHVLGPSSVARVSNMMHILRLQEQLKFFAVENPMKRVRKAELLAARLPMQLPKCWT